MVLSSEPGNGQFHPTLSSSTLSKQNIAPTMSTTQKGAPATGGRPLNGAPSQGPQRRTLTVNEALQYSPFSSIVPLDARLISLPTADIPSSQSAIADSILKQNSRQQLNQLNQGIADGQTTTEASRVVLRTLADLLDPDQIPEFMFKRPSATEDEETQLKGQREGSKKRGPAEELGSLAKMLQKSSKITFRHSVTSTPLMKLTTTKKNDTASRTSKPAVPKQPTTTGFSKTVATNNQAHSHNSRLLSLDQNSPGQQILQSPMIAASSISSAGNVATSAHNKPLVEVISSSTTSPPAAIPPTSEIPAPSRKRKRDEDENGSGQSNDQRAASNAALQALRELLTEIFETENDAQLDQIESSSSQKPFSTARNGADLKLVVLSSDYHSKLDTCLQKVIAHGRFAEIPVDQVLHLQQLCDNALASGDKADIGLQNDLNDDEISAWLERLEVFHGVLRATRTALRTMTGGREEKKIYSEELLQKILETSCHALDTCVIPVVESRSSGQQSGLFSTATAHRKAIGQVLHTVGKSMQLLLELLSKTELAEGTVTMIEFFAIRMLFVENAYNEKEAALGTAKFENFRRVAMNIISEIFLRYPDQRRFIVDEILTSLQKLPTTRQHARQFKLGDGSSMQLVSALLLRLVQTSGTRSPSDDHRNAQQALPKARRDSRSLSGNDESEPENSEDGELEPRLATEITEDENVEMDKLPSSRFIAMAKILHDSALMTAQLIIRFFVTRASTSAKSGDQPYRHLLDIFMEDLITVLGQPEWPAAELLLRALITRVDSIIHTEKSTAPAKTMALEIMGTMGSAISDITAGARQLSRTLETDDSALSEQLIQTLEDQMTRGHDSDASSIYGWDGPFRVVLEYLRQNHSDSHTVSAQGFHLTQWTKLVLWGQGLTSEAVAIFSDDEARQGLARKLCAMLPDRALATTDDFEPPSTLHCRLAHFIIINSMAFCRAFNHILKVLLTSIGSDQISIRTRSIKSVTQMLEKDPTLLDRAPMVINLISKSLSDKSSLVRDNALALMGKCIVLKPALESEVLKYVLSCTNDAVPLIRKRSMKLSKEVYLRNSDTSIRSAVAESLLRRILDPDDGCADLAKQTLEDIWFLPFPSNSHPAGPVQEQIALKAQVSLIISTIRRDDTVGELMGTFLRYALSTKSRSASANATICGSMVAAAFNGIIDHAELPEENEQMHILQSLMVFANASPSLFSQQQLEHLKPYISSLSTADDLHLFRSVVVILRCVLPTLPAIRKEFLRQVQDDLLKNVSKLPKVELNEVVNCLWTINGQLNNVERLVNLEISVLANLHKMEAFAFDSSERAADLSRAKRFIYLAAHFAKHCDFQSHESRFHHSLKWWEDAAVVENILKDLKPYSQKHQPPTLRAVALESIGMVCEAWPKYFNQADIVQEFRGILRRDQPEVQQIVLASFRDFFASQDRNHGSNVVAINPDGGADRKLGASLVANDNDGAAALIAQGFLKDILHIALSSEDVYAQTATEVVASIARQGLVHPKECGPALVALETSTNAAIAHIAFQQHFNLHQQHESMFEREYMRALHEAFTYQQSIVQSVTGYVGPPYQAKLHSMYEVIKTSKSKYQAKFFSNYCARIDFDVSKLVVSSADPPHLQYARFLIENLAFFEYGRVEDLMHTISCMEKIVAATGAGIAHAISTEMLCITLHSVLATENQAPPAMAEEPVPHQITTTRQVQLTTGSIILSMLWEARTFLRRLYGISAGQHKRDSKKAAKDMTKAPTKVQGVSGDRFVDSIAKLYGALGSHEQQLAQCTQFAELLAIDNELKVAVDGEENPDSGLQTPSGDEANEGLLTPGGDCRSIKRKTPVPQDGSPHKKKLKLPLAETKERQSSMAIEEEIA